jgi:hypothetical protein
MRLAYGLTLVLAAALIVPSTVGVGAQDANRKVAGGGITIPGWQGKMDSSKENTGSTIQDGKLAMEGQAIKVTTGPSAVYWNPKNVAQGNYTVKATFTEPEYMNINSHPHPYGVFIGGNDMGTDNQSLLYCAAYGNGRFIVRGFGPAAFQMNGRGAEAPSVSKAAGPKQPVKQEIAMTVKGDQVTCDINGQTVATYTKADLVAAGKLKSTDGVYGLRSGHNTDVMVTGLAMTKN